MGSYDRSQVCNTNLALGLGSVANLAGKSPEKNQEEASDHLSLSLNLVLGDQSGKNCSSEECDMNDVDGKNNASGSRKKLRLSKEQSSVLEESFKHHNTLNLEQKNSLATQLNLMPRQVEVWFQNRRARTKLKLTETDCERWKKGYKEMVEENNKLKEEMEMLQTCKRIKINGSTNFSEARPNGGSSLVCPNCRRGWLMTGDNVGGVDDRPVVLKPKPNFGAVKLLG